MKKVIGGKIHIFTKVHLRKFDRPLAIKFFTFAIKFCFPRVCVFSARIVILFVQKHRSVRANLLFSLDR